ncbi:MAG: 50S ribosomal protein L6 [Proteobacteria bacterium]|nr:50S ribosomal protein L6 [Pseudomonadota bacterium]
MSKIGKMPIEVPSSVSTSLNGSLFVVNGVRGELSFSIPDFIDLRISDNVINIEPKKDGEVTMIPMWGTVRAIVYNMIFGASQGWVKELEIVGVGYKASISNRTLILSLGYSHEVRFAVPDGVDIECPSQISIIVKGADKQLVGQVASNIRSFKKPEPYKGKGIRYKGENIRRKVGKKK